MPVSMTLQKLPKKEKQIKAMLSKEFNFLKNVFSVMSLPKQMRDDYEENADFEIINDPTSEEKEVPKRARSIAELEEKLEKIKSQKNFNLKNKLAKKSLNSKLNKKLKKNERQKKSKVKPTQYNSTESVKEVKIKSQANVKPVFNTEGKLVFSKFDFSNIGHKEKMHQKAEKDPKKILENLKQQEQKFKELEETQYDKVKEMKEKIAWKNVLLKAEGEKIKDDPILLKKSIKKLEQKKKDSKKQWDNRIKNVEEKKDARQKKRKENIAKKKKEKKSKVVKAAVKRGRIII
ncbi:surfeit locus protein 6 homolog isoform X3 [Hyposmocoma kahamanoa]|nr:surfeit locus protein 6 homolog isoform X3 [Hyposmocoma kahamanoa]XP_026323891.1 surfeit locus protein 6 homolog isoform X3 [Hyposmocoma kahamanoa]XP_026323892.1 surfeit locus protein 6 homolog isoform X3 [Hyposmocoma kahamanoa]XP_026323893.1 surfeit locus protein 6 homolog isoform X3 [Hyposmocoma kahamanoa]